MRNFTLAILLSILALLGTGVGAWTAISNDVEGNTNNITSISKQLDSHIDDKDEYLRKDVADERFNHLSSILERVEEKIDNLSK